MLLAAGPVVHQMKTRAADSALGQRRKRFAVERGVYVRDAARRISRFGDGVHDHAVVVSVRGWRDENRPGEPGDLLHAAVVLDRGGRRRVAALIGVRKNIGRPEYMRMGVAG